MHPIFESFLADLCRLGRSPLTVRRYGDVLRGLDAFTGRADPSTIARHDLLRFAVAPRTDGRARSPADVNLRIAVLKATFGYLVGEGLVPDNRAASLVGLKQPRRTPDYLSANEVRRLLAHIATRRGSHRSRDLILVLFFWQTGLRVSEVARLTWTDLDHERRCLMNVLVKGGHRRDVPLNDQLLGALRVHQAKSSAAPIFVGRRDRPLSVRSIQALFSKWQCELGWARRLHPHVLRRTHATGALALGVDISTVADLLGHSDLRTVTAYAAVQDGARRAALRGLGKLVPTEILRQIGPVRIPANDVDENTCVEERFYEPSWGSMKTTTSGAAGGKGDARPKRLRTEQCLRPFDRVGVG